jgi:hypothetical protein
MMIEYVKIATRACCLVALIASIQNSHAAYIENFDNVSNITVNSDPLKWAWLNKSQNAASNGAATDPSIGGWFQGTPNGPPATFNAQAGAANSYARADYSSAPLGNVFSNWFITPTFDFVAGDTFSFFTRTLTNSAYPDRLQIRQSSSLTSINVGNDWTTVGDFTQLLGEINPNLQSGGYPETWSQFTYNISTAFTGRIAFRYYVTDTNSNGNYIGLDTFSTSANLFTPIPEPSTYVLSSLACFTFTVIARRRKKSTVSA